MTKRHWDIFIAGRAFYQDIAEWALVDASWAEWAFRSPVRKRDTEGAAKQTRATVAAMHQRTRERLPNLPWLVDAAEQWKNDRATLLRAAGSTVVGATLEHAGVRYRRVGPGERPRVGNQRPSHIVVENLADATMTNVTVDEGEAFWAWAVIETLRHTGIRIEELLELTQLAIVSHRLADTGELVPLLQVVPSRRMRNVCCSSHRNWPASSPRSSAGYATPTARFPSSSATTAPSTSPGQNCRTCSNAVTASGTAMAGARTKLAGLDRAARNHQGPTVLGLPTTRSN